MPRVAGPKRAAGVSSSAPVRELGTILQGVFSYDGMAPWSNFVDDQEYVPELVWPRSINTMEQVRCDAQVSALLKAYNYPMRRLGNWSINSNGVTQNERVDRLAKMLNLPIQGESVKRPHSRMKGRFVFADHVRLAGLGPVFGHYYFEQVGKIDDDGLWTLKRLAPRPPRTIANFKISPQDGGLISIVQNVAPNIPGMNRQRDWTPFGPYPEIPIDNLVGYVWEKEGANWAGRSMLRDIYKNWVMKDQLMRIDTINHSRAGGVPIITAHPDATTTEVGQLSMLAQSFRVGDTAGGAIPSGGHVDILRAGTNNAVDSIKYHDESMARNFMLMVLILGTTRSGSRNLGSTFTEFWSEGVNAMADWFCDHFNEYVIEDYWDWNYGEDEQFVPRLEYTADPELNATDIAAMIKVGAIEVDDDLEFALRKEFGLPDKGTPRHNQILLPTSMAENNPEGGETPAGSGSTATKPSGQKEGGEQKSQNEKELEKSQAKA